MLKRDKHLPLLVFFILLIGFLFFFSGVPGTDDEQLFASASQSFVLIGKFSAAQVYGNQRLEGYYASIAPFHVWIGSLVYRLAEWLKTGGLQCFFLLSPFYSALTGYLLAEIAQKRGYSSNTILISILVYGFGTMVFAYSKTYFREPLAMLLMTTAFYEMDHALVEKPGITEQFLRIAASLIFLVLAIWTKEFLIVFAPLLICYYVFAHKKNKKGSITNSKKDPSPENKYSLILILIFTIFIGFLFLRDSSGRFSVSYILRLFTYFPNLSHEHSLQSLWGSF